MSEPAPTISMALVLATAKNKQEIIVCNGTFDEHVTITAADGAVKIYGGFKCPGNSAPWTYDGTSAGHALVKPTTAGSALQIADSTAGLVIEDVDFFSPEGTSSSSGSSIGVIVARSTDITIRRSRVQAGNGADGAKGADGVDAAHTTNFAGIGGNPSGAFALGGFWPDPSACGSMGGRGASNMPGSKSEPGIPVADIILPKNDNSVTTGGAGKGKAGGIGSNGNSGTIGVAAAVAGAFDASGFTTADGGNGTDGYTAQGGGGGAGSIDPAGGWGASGGAGGLGGCGGTLGFGGIGGGASVALLAWDSTLFIEDVTLESRNGGKGGQGGSGGHGAMGSQGGFGGPQDAAKGIPAGGDGGNGGNGGNGGSGAGGSGGPSYGIVFHLAAPIELGKIVFIGGIGGAKGVGGSISGAAKSPDGTDGAKGDRFEQK